jgi:two-component system, chemotaxis family, CheB/CheR fusion protein
LANDRARQRFGLSPRDIGRPFQDLQISYRPPELRAAIKQAYEKQSEVFLNSVVWTPTSSDKRFLDIIVTPLMNNGNGIIAVLISFIDITLQIELQEKLEHSNLELETAMSELQSSNEELETTNEELQSTIEELETTNEELQSSNEEMETMNEELQSTNEELETMTVETRAHSEELYRVNRLLEAIVTSLHGGVIVVDKEMRVITWKHKSEDL